MADCYMEDTNPGVHGLQAVLGKCEHGRMLPTQCTHVRACGCTRDLPMVYKPTGSLPLAVSIFPMCAARAGASSPSNHGAEITTRLRIIAAKVAVTTGQGPAHLFRKQPKSTSAQHSIADYTVCSMQAVYLPRHAVVCSLSIPSPVHSACSASNRFPDPDHTNFCLVPRFPPCHHATSPAALPF